MFTIRRLMIGALALAAILISFAPAHSTDARTGVYRLTILRVAYSDASTFIYTKSQIQQAGKEIHDYYTKLSYGNLDVEVTVADATVSGTKDFYWKACAKDGVEPRVPCPPPLVADATQAAAASGFSFTGINGISLLSPWCATDFTSLAAITVVRPGVSGTFQLAGDFECPFPPGFTQTNGPSRVNWGGWAHELGHQLENEAPITNWHGGWGGHPSGYSSGYDLMDSCYPCGESAYGLLAAPVMNGNRTVFPGWLPPSKVITDPLPAKTPTAQTYVLASLSDNPSATPAAQAIKVAVAPGTYYLVQVRRRAGADAIQTRNDGRPGLYDQGVQIQQIDENGDPPVHNIYSCNFLVKEGCADPNNPSELRNSACQSSGPLVASNPPYCWPYPLWHVGQSYFDGFNNIRVRINAATGTGMIVTIERGGVVSHPDLFIVPWLSPPMNTWETTGIWVDSSCNGYEENVGKAGLRYGRRADGTVIGNGDDPCANHENRIYTTVRNIGDAPANNVRVNFRVSDPLGVGVVDSKAFLALGTVTSAEFPALASLAPGASTVVYLPWTPKATLTPAQIAAGHFNLHSCVQVVIDPVPGEINTGNNQAQENFSNFEARRDTGTGAYGATHTSFFLRNPFGHGQLDRGFEAAPRTFYLGVTAQLPAGWHYRVGRGWNTMTLNPDEVREVPVTISVPRGQPVGSTHLLTVNASTFVVHHLAALMTPPGLPRTHIHAEIVSGAVLAAQAVVDTKLSLHLTFDPNANQIVATGQLTPVLGATKNPYVALDITAAPGQTFTRLVRMAGNGTYRLTLPLSSGVPQSVRALWQGDLVRGSAVSPAVSPS